jgi:uncharacterized protein HemY
MNIENPFEFAYLPNGEPNTSFILSNANLLMKNGELDLAVSLFLLVKNHVRYGYCGHYGLGQCFLRMSHPKEAVLAFEKAYSLKRRAYIAAALVEALLECGEYKIAEERSIEFALEFSNESGFVDLFRMQYEKASRGSIQVKNKFF